MENEIRSGVLYVQKGSGLVKKLQKRYAALYKRSSHGVSRIELFDTKENYDKRLKGAKRHLISLESCATITRSTINEGKKPEYLIYLTFNDNKEQILQAENDEDKEMWYAAISNVIFGGGADLLDNVIYQQYEDEGYEVTIKENDVVNRLSLRGSYYLSISDEDIELKDKSNKHVVAKWPLQLLRKYGRDKQEFSLEAGRRCPTGPGMFYFITDHYNAIFQVVDNKVRNLAERGRAHSTSSVRAVPSPTFVTNPPDSPLPSPLPPLSPQVFTTEHSVYDDPLDMRKNTPQIEESIYNEPVNAKPTRKQKPAKTSPKHLKPDKAQKNAGNGKVSSSAKPQVQTKPDGKWFKGGKKDGKKDKKHKTPSAPPPSQIEDATYAEALPISDPDMNEYGQLDFEGRGPQASNGGMESAYDSLNVDWPGGKPNTVEDSQYATAADLHQRFRDMSAEESVYDKVKR